MASKESQSEYFYDRYLEAIEKLPQPDIFSGYVWRPAFVTPETAMPDAPQELRYILRLTEDVLPDYDGTFIDYKLHSRAFADLFNKHSSHPVVQAYTQGITIIQPNTPWPEIVKLLNKEIEIQESVRGLVEGPTEHAT